MTMTTSSSRRTMLKLGGMGAAILACPSIVRAAADQEILIANVVALTGANSGWGQPNWNGFQLACEMINAKGGIKNLGGAKLKPVVGDTETKPQVAGSQAERLIQRGVVAVAGTNDSAATMVVTQVCERHQVPFISSSEVVPEITGRGLKYTFRTPPLMETLARDMLSYMKELASASGSPIGSVAILCASTLAGKLAYDGAQKLAGTMGINVVDASIFDSGTQNFTPYVAKYRAANVDAVIGHQQPNDAIAIVRTMKQLDYNPKFTGGLLGGHSSREFMETLGADAEGIFGTTSFGASIERPGLQEATKAYWDRYQKQLDSTGAAGFTEVALIADALERAGDPDPKRVRDAISSSDVKFGDGLYLQLNGAKFDAAGNNTSAGAAVFTISKSKALVVAPQEYANAKGTYPKPSWQS
jgi:branched-chain amino acid transport system substrate-binding protein